MRKREEIREGLSDRIYGLGHQPPDIDEILKYLHSQGVVIKVAGELPWIEHPKYFKEGIRSDQDLETFAKTIELQVRTEVVKAGYRLKGEK